ncbi:MAG TPA: MMPL family transporter [Thermoanaerobaculia bacterium]|nr:MMPL family transporter [Thermoanaerobaculia bacterium]
MTRRSLSGLLEGLLRFSVRHPWEVLGIIAILTVAAVPCISGVRLRLDGRSLIPEELPAQMASDRAAELFDLRDVVVVGVSSADGDIYSPRTLGLLASLSSDLAETQGIVPGSVGSLATLPRFFVQEDVLDPQPLLARGHPPGAELAARLRRETEALGLDDGVLVSRDGSTAALYAEVRPEADRYQVLEQVRGLATRAGGPDRVLLSGTALAQAVLGLAAAQDLIRLLPAVLLAIFLALTVLFRHPVPALVSLAEIGVSLVWTAGILGARGESMFVTTLVLPVILLVIGVSDDVYALSRTFRRLREAPGEPAGEAIVGSFAAVGRPILLTGATTIAGLLSLTAADLEPQRVFGLYGALSILFSTLFTFTFVPAMLSVLRPSISLGGEIGRSDGRPPILIRGLRRIGPRRFLAAAAVGVALAAWAATRLRIEDDWVRNLPPSSDVASATRSLDRALAGTIRVEVLVDSGRRDGFLDPSVFARLGRIEQAFASLPGVGAVHSVYGDVVRVQSALDGERYASWRSALDGRRRSLGRADLEQALLLLTSLRRSPLSEHIDADYRRARVTVFVRSANYSRISRIVRETSALSTGGLILTPFGDGWISYLAVRLLVLGQIRSVGFALLSNALLLLLLFRRLPDTLLALAPILVSVLVVFAALSLAGIPLGIANSMFAAIALGIGIDYSIHLVAQYREQLARGLPAEKAIEGAVAVTGPAIFKSAVAIAAGLSVFGFSEVLPNLQLGILVTLSLTVCAAMTLLLIPGIVLARTER